MSRLFYHPLPDWFCQRELCRLHPFAQSILMCIVRHKNNDTGLAHPSTYTIQRECGISENSVTKYLRELVAKDVIAIKKQYVSKRTSRYGKAYRAFRYEYELKISTEDPQKSLRDELRKVNQRIDKMQFDFSKLSAELREWEKFLRPVAKVKGVWQFETNTDLSPSFVEQQFKEKAGIKIHILRKAS